MKGPSQAHRGIPPSACDVGILNFFVTAVGRAKLNIERVEWMLETIPIGLASEVPLGASKIFESDGRRVAVFNLDGQFHAIDNSCPHRGASLAVGELSGTTVSCPLHGWEFDVVTGDCTSHAGNPVERFEVHVEEGELRIEIPPAVETPPVKDDGVHRYLIRYGALGWVAWFGSIESVECRHKDRVVVNTSRGLELGEVLSSPLDGRRPLSVNAEKPTGEVLRRASEDDLAQVKLMSAEPPGLLDACEQLLAAHDPTVDVVDFEFLFDGKTIVLYFLGEQLPELETIGEQLSKQFHFEVRFFPLVEPPPQAGGCGSGGCGSGGCGTGHE
ncbi:3-phenylpropionate/cinnamic acid dioxygenase ferredoxin subunit [Symmachiella dynata]|uniref:3-phenylpropionate/cinnamic acid dioxygenase ferredoxin subunit n=2 Tax=Symmachiella dynata TaxID=2527995 RepID=A0A517ZWX9_9PLAN|nr:3-phenylpropionate/cinnamic acid dioxygenase ferredoxin subunit [Symmachiella dynata]QDU46935.1 3-phenylpropionate/cinnamic acid dioxygenase ferredoxin subunit [Symmachiella dynata]